MDSENHAKKGFSAQSRSWSGLVFAAVVGAGAALALLLFLSRLGVTVWLAELGKGPLANISRQALSSKTFELTGLMLYGAHFIPLKMTGFAAQAGIPVPGWTHFIPVLPLILGGYLTVLMGQDRFVGRAWLGGIISVPYTLLLMLLIGVFTIKFDFLLFSVSIAPSWELAILLIPVWSLTLGAVGGMLAGQE